MKIKSKKVLAQSKDVIQVQEQDLQSQDIMSEEEEAKELEDYYSGSGINKLQREYEIAGLEYGDRLRVIGDNSRELFDVILMPNGQIGVQVITLRVEYGQHTSYNSWEDAMEQLPEMFTVEKAIVAKRLLAKINDILDEKEENPYA